MVFPSDCLVLAHRGCLIVGIFPVSVFTFKYKAPYCHLTVCKIKLKKSLCRQRMSTQWLQQEKSPIPRKGCGVGEGVVLLHCCFSFLQAEEWRVCVSVKKNHFELCKHSLIPARAVQTHLRRDSKFMVTSINFSKSRTEIWCCIKERDLSNSNRKSLQMSR